MSYQYQVERVKLFNDEGQRLFLRVRERARTLLETAGAFREAEALSGFMGDTWLLIACLDRMVELGEIVVVRENCWSQFRVFSTRQTNNR